MGGLFDGAGDPISIVVGHEGALTICIKILYIYIYIFIYICT